MTRQTTTPAPSDRDPVTIDTTTAHTSRIYDHLLGGTDNFAVDREVAAHAFAAYPGGLDGARADARANRAFLGRAVRHLVEEAGIRQFLDIGTGIPNADNTHAIAQGIDPDTRIVYVDNDPIVLAHAHALLANAAAGRAAYIDGDLRRPEPLLEQAAATLDLGRPIAVMVVGVLHVIPDGDDPYGHLATLMAAVPSGSYLALSHITVDTGTEGGDMAAVHARLDETMSATNPPALRTHAEVVRFFEGLDVVDPGVVQAARWRPDPDTEAPAGRQAPLVCGVARKP